MAMGRKTGGRRKGVPNKATAEVKAAIQKHGHELVEALLALTKSDDERVRLSAILAALDRGWGRPTQAVDLGGEMAITKIERVIIKPENRSTAAPSGWSASVSEARSCSK